MTTSYPLSGRRALVTGGTRGIGAAIAERLRADGAEVSVTGTQPFGQGPDGTHYHPVDFTDDSAAETFAAMVAGHPPDILINSAGINRVAPFADIDPADFRRIQQVNVTTPFLLSRAVLPGMRRHGWGRIVMIGSIWGHISRAGRGSYSTAKSAIEGMTAALAAEVARDGILVNTVSPGFIDTELTRQVLGDKGIAELLTQVPIGRLGKPEEIAELVTWLAGPKNSYISGQSILIDGGFTRV